MLPFLISYVNVANFTAQTVTTGNDFLINDDTATHTGSQGNHDQILISLASALPHLSQGSHVGVISALYSDSVQQAAEFFLGIHPAPSQVNTYLHKSIRHHRSGDSQPDTYKVRLETQPSFLHPGTDGLGHIRKDMRSAFLLTGLYFPLVQKLSRNLKKSDFYRSSSDIYSDTFHPHGIYTSFHFYSCITAALFPSFSEVP